MSRPDRILCCLGFPIASLALSAHPLRAAADAMAAIITLDAAPQATIIYDLDSRPLFTFVREQRIDVPLDRVSPEMIAAVISIEDRRFYQQRGIDFMRRAG